MAEIISNGKRKGTPRIDLTPMVDLGFILITFFLFTTTLLKPNSMELNMPVEGPPTEVPDHLAYKLFLGKEHQWYVLKGEDAMKNKMELREKMDTKNMYAFRKSVAQFRSDIQAAITSKRKGTHPNDDLIVMIKPLPGSDYGDLVNALDEMNINQIQRYVLLDADADELQKASNLHW